MKYPRYYVGINHWFCGIKYFRVDSSRDQTNFRIDGGVSTDHSTEEDVRHWLNQNMIKEVPIEELVLMF